MGVDKSPKGKADDDFDKRTAETSPEEQQRRVFVFVTPRVWQKKDDWAADKQMTTKWRGVVVLDANDLEHWLEIAPGVDAWFARLTGRTTPGVQDVAVHWRALQTIAEHPLSPAVFTSSREEQIARVRDWLSGPPGSLFIRTQALSDGPDFITALSVSEDNERLRGALLVATVDAWRHLTASQEPLVLIADPALELTATDAAGAVAAGHHVVVSGPRGIVGDGNAVVLGRQEYTSVSKALEECGFSESRARLLGQACCGSSSILKRLITRHPETRFPEWSRDDLRSALAPFALIGGWTHVNPPSGAAPRYGAPAPLDVWVVTEMLGCTREELDRHVARWQRAVEPLFLRFGASVLVASREDAWHLLGGSLTAEQLLRFRELALLVLDEDNPAFQLAPEQRWLANLYGKVHSLSGELRHSVVESLALMATYPTADREPSIDFVATVHWVLERALPRNATWQRWASFGHDLKVVAEAAPDLFLARVEDDLNARDPELPKLFQDHSSVLFAGAIHSDLLWSLESLAWNSLYLERIAVALAKLAARDPGGKYANRPANSLGEIFLSWLWHTNANTGQRIHALRRVLDAEPVVGWKLLTGLLPSNRPSTSMNTCMPRWRPWAEGWSQSNLQPQRGEYELALANLTMDVAATDPVRWADAVEGLLDIDPTTTERVLAALGAIAETPEPTPAKVFPLWDRLRELVARHERHASAKWSLPADLRQRLSDLRDRLAPNDPALLHYHLFDHFPTDLPGLDPSLDTPSYEAALRQARIAALRLVADAGGAEGIFRLLGLVQTGNVVGWLVGEECLVPVSDLGLPASLENTDNQKLAFIGSYLSCRFSKDGWNFVNAISTADWSARQVATLARCLPFGSETWEWLQLTSAEACREYWSKVAGYHRLADPDQVRFACSSLIGVGRPFEAVGVLQAAIHDRIPVASELIAEVLEATFKTESQEAVSAVNTARYGLQQLVGLLQRDGSVEPVRLAGIEWALLPVLDPETSEVQPATIIGLVESSPEFFVHLLAAVYRGENEAPPESPLPEQDQFRARNARELLGNLDRLPGEDNEGVIDFAYLRSWVAEVRSLATACHRLRMCDYTLGELFARASTFSDGESLSTDLAAVLEEIGTESAFDGFEVAVLNGRGVVARGLYDGGVRERSLATRFRGLADQIRPSSQQLAEAFLRIARHYEAHAAQEDEEAERRRLGR
jgi:hypothetical protein